MKQVPGLRIRAVNDRPANPDGDYVLYWMIAHRRLTHNFALQRAVEHAREHGKPLVILEALRSGYRWASDRLHRFVIDGMADHARALENSPVLHYPYVEPDRGAGKGLLAALAARACIVVTDEFPCFMLPRMVAAAARQVEVRLETVDANGILPLRAAESRVFPTAYAFRRFLQQNLRQHLDAFPKIDPLARLDLPRLSTLPAAITGRWPRAAVRLLAGAPGTLDSLPIDHTVAPGAARGGHEAAKRLLQAFLERKLDRYGDRNQPQEDVTSGLSPYLHFGHIGAHEVVAAVLKRETWTADALAKKADGSRAGWWGVSEAAEEFLDQVVTWRELGYNMSFHRPGDYDRYESLPAWARESLEKHATDERTHVYSLAEFEAAKTHDPLWNAAQNQLRAEGTIHNYLRMLWAKKILEWSASPRDALDVMIELNNRYGLDGRNPNSYSGIFWCLGRYDRPWGPERPVYGVIRYMSSENTARKVRVKDYVARYTAQGDLFAER